MAMFSGILGPKIPLRRGILVAFGVWFCTTSAATAAPAYDGLFDVSARKAAIAADTSGRLRKQCLAIKADSKWLDLEVVEGFRPTAGYGSDRAGAQFAWAVMVLSGRALGGDASSTTMLRSLLNTWADRGAFEKNGGRARRLLCAEARTLADHHGFFDHPRRAAGRGTVENPEMARSAGSTGRPNIQR
ncbi:MULTISPECIES: hypothetical protein [Agrobacterium]|uniref:hypothetical protein n=1 Tax=Agrobacterium TaxID=357 RepID=UPI0009D307C3|nr:MULTISPECIES: hypothetical protein [Agrobacterium]CUX65427.1 exported hypothetical protein [Agrobacterium sp. NCPPB 925]